MASTLKDLAELSLGELLDELKATKQEALNLRFRNATGQLDNTAEIGKVIVGQADVVLSILLGGAATAAAIGTPLAQIDSGRVAFTSLGWMGAVAVVLAGTAGWVAGGWLPAEVPSMVNLRAGTPFWEVAGEAGEEARTV